MWVRALGAQISGMPYFILRDIGKTEGLLRNSTRSLKPCVERIGGTSQVMPGGYCHVLSPRAVEEETRGKELSSVPRNNLRKAF